ncbi:hypothetical protein [Halomonas sp. OfavH-34-E]|uniref:hypothetical protein n=1 Tax=Halomonas sp. OfavH-34-E TaxID=2954491 RepID=UPI0020976A35|nr:hypothetical protein [Halomonas sp. OfavH-34-E]MCO7215996.1 hypothetical protein [Halomonas sp. OfavH-34-E]
MPQIKLKQPQQPVAEFSVSGTTVTVGGVAVDCAARQADSSTVVEVRRNNGVAEEGGTGAYLAHIEIPARTYHEEQAAESGAEGEEPGTIQVADPLDPDAVVITLWPATNQ